MEKQVRFSLRLVAAIFFVLAALVAVSIMPAQAGASSAGFPMYSWGSNTNGRLGRGLTAPPILNDPTPARVGTDYWVSASASNGAYAINANGELYVWGAIWSSSWMGLGGNQPPAEYLTGNSAGTAIARPFRLGNASNWEMVTSRSSNVAALNSDGEIFRWGQGQISGTILPVLNVPTQIGEGTKWVYVVASNGFILAINEDGHLYSMGDNTNGQLGHGDTTSRTTFTRVGDRDDWVSVSVGPNFVTGITEGDPETEGGKLWTWGINGSGQLGQDDTIERHTPTRVGTADNWAEVKVSTNTAAALNSDGQIYTWGAATTGQLGNGTTTPSVLAPERMGTASNWVALSGGGSYFMAFNTANELYAWGSHTNGQLGIGPPTAGRVETTPQFVLRAYGFGSTSRDGTSTVFMLMHTTPVEADEFFLEKRLQKPEGTNLLTDKTFTFNFTPHSFNGNTANLTPIPNIPNRTITLGQADTPTVANGIATRTDVVDVLDGISFNQAGVFAWTVTEAATAGINAPSNMQDSQAEYVLRVYVVPELGAFVIDIITLHRLRCDDGVVYSPPDKTDDFSFTNIYTRTTTGGTGAYGALTISKIVDGDFAPAVDFDFDITLTKTALCPANRVLVGRIYNADNSFSGTSVSFDFSEATETSFPISITEHVELSDGQRIVFAELLVGTRFDVTERAADLFRASVDVLVNGVAVPIDPNEYPDEDLWIEGPHIAGDSENSAAFTNVHFFSPPTGIVVGNAPAALPIIAAIGVALLLASKHRRRIEEMPVV